MSEQSPPRPERPDEPEQPEGQDRRGESGQTGEPTGTSEADIRAERLILERAIGGWRGMVDSGLPTVVFICVYVVAARQLAPALIAAVAAGVVLAGYRLIRRQPLQQVATGFLGLAIAAGFSALTGQAENFFLPGLITNAVYGTAFALSILVRWPLLGVAMGYLTGDGTAWRRDVALMRTYAAASWIWVGVFFGRLVVQVPLYLSGNVELLGVARVVMGWPLFLAGAYLTYRVLAPVYRAKRAASD